MHAARPEYPTELLTRWGDPAFLKSDIQAEFPVSELRGKSEAEFISCLIQVPNVRIDVGIKLLNASKKPLKYLDMLENTSGNKLTVTTAITQ